VLPTRLGNVLRRYEMSAGTPFGIELIPCVPRLGRVGADRELQYVENQRTQLELAVRIAVLGGVAAVVTVVVMWQQGFWMLIALGPYGLAYLSYRGSIVAAHEYGTALSVLIELNRFTLYERLHLKLPANLREEKNLNRTLMTLLRSGQVPLLDYTHPTPATAEPTPAAADSTQPTPEDGTSA
jgi:hypothetical protein